MKIEIVETDNNTIWFIWKFILLLRLVVIFRYIVREHHILSYIGGMTGFIPLIVLVIGNSKIYFTSKKQ